MFDYARKMKLATSDKLRRLELMTGAGLVLAIGAGFLLSALWLALSRYLGWGPIAASLVIGLALVAAGLVLLLAARNERHPAPTADELKREIEQQLNLVANAAIGRVTDTAEATMDRAVQKAGLVMDMAENKVHAFTDNLGYRANRMADRAEARTYGAARHLNDSAPRTARIMPILAVVAAGITLASRISDLRRGQGDDQPPEK